MQSSGDLTLPVVRQQPLDFATALADREHRIDALAFTVESAIESLAAQLSAGHSTDFLTALAFWSRFHKYSFANSLLICRQCPGATLVAGVRRWNEQGYRIRAGEKAIWIWCPIIRKGRKDQLDELDTLVGFRPGPVFDASQLANLDEQPLPELVRILPDDAEPVYQRAVSRIRASGITVEERLLPNGIYGVSQGGKIVIRQGLDSRNRLFTLLHEHAHELAHRGEAQRAKSLKVRELEAEAACFVASSAMGLESVCSRDYLLTYEVSVEELRSALGAIHHLVRTMLAIVDPLAAG